MQHQIKISKCEQTQPPSLNFVYSIARLLQADPTDLLGELGYFRPEMGKDAKVDARSNQPAQNQKLEYSGYYLG